MASCNNCSTPNQLPPCPIRMSDARAFTDYRPRCPVNSELINTLSIQNMINSSYEARMYLQKNADMIMKQEYNRAVNNIIPCAPCSRGPNDPSTMEPERYIVECNATSCSRKEINPLGIGDGRKY
jgi:hypothetical protein